LDPRLAVALAPCSMFDLVRRACVVSMQDACACCQMLLHPVVSALWCTFLIHPMQYPLMPKDKPELQVAQQRAMASKVHQHQRSAEGLQSGAHPLCAPCFHHLQCYEAASSYDQCAGTHQEKRVAKPLRIGIPHRIRMLSASHRRCHAPLSANCQAGLLKKKLRTRAPIDTGVFRAM